MSGDNTPGINKGIFTIRFDEPWKANGTQPLYGSSGEGISPQQAKEALKLFFNPNSNLIMEKVSVDVFSKRKDGVLPSYATPFSSGVDLMADVEENSKIIVYPGQRVIIKTGLHVAIPDGFEMQIRPRSGLAAKKGITVLNTPGTIDSDYRGEIGVIIMNFGDEAVAFANGEKIAQGVIVPVYQLEWNKVNAVEELSSTLRGQGGFGSTGI